MSRCKETVRRQGEKRQTVLGRRSIKQKQHAYSILPVASRCALFTFTPIKKQTNLKTSVFEKMEEFNLYTDATDLQNRCKVFFFLFPKVAEEPGELLSAWDTWDKVILNFSHRRNRSGLHRFQAAVGTNTALILVLGGKASQSGRRNTD